MKENDTQELNNSLFLNVIVLSMSFLVIFPKIIPRGVARFFQFRVALCSCQLLWSTTLL